MQGENVKISISKYQIFNSCSCDLEIPIRYGTCSSAFVDIVIIQYIGIDDFWCCKGSTIKLYFCIKWNKALTGEYNEMLHFCFAHNKLLWPIIPFTVNLWSILYEKCPQSVYKSSCYFFISSQELMTQNHRSHYSIISMHVVFKHIGDA